MVIVVFRPWHQTVFHLGSGFVHQFLFNYILSSPCRHHRCSFLSIIYLPLSSFFTHFTSILFPISRLPYSIDVALRLIDNSCGARRLSALLNIFVRRVVTKCLSTSSQPLFGFSNFNFVVPLIIDVGARS
jgi:hypothetical protein